MKAPSLTLFAAAAVLLPTQVDAQLAEAVDPGSSTMRHSAVISMRPSMVARYATIPERATMSRFTMSPPTVLVRQLVGAALTVAAISSRIHPLLPTGVRMVRHDH